MYRSDGHAVMYAFSSVVVGAVLDQALEAGALMRRVELRAGTTEDAPSRAVTHQ